MRIALLIVFSIAAVAANRFVTDSADPSGAGMDPARLARIATRMQAFVDEGRAAGFVTLVGRHGHIANLAAAGYRDLETKTPMRTDTIFRLASVTKPITCAGVMTLVDEGRISLIDPVEKYLPEFRGQKLNPCGARGGYHCGLISPVRPINIKDLMTHTSGLIGSAPKDAEARTLAESVAAGAKTALLFEPGTQWSYSSLGIDALGRIVEVVSGQSFDRFMAERMFQPLGMKDTHFFVPSEKESRVAALYTDEGGKLVRSDRPRSKFPVPAGGLFSTASDLARFYQMTLNKGTLDGPRILSAAAIELMTTNQTGSMPEVGWAPGVGYGFGWGVVREAAGMYRYNSIGTYGSGGAFRTYGWVDPAKDMIGVILYQRTNGGGDVADEINAFMALCAAAIER